MPKGVYARGPGKKSKAQEAGNGPPRKFGKANFGKKINNSTVQQAGPGGANKQNKCSWINQLMNLGYGRLGNAPNLAVQSIIYMIPNNEIHEAILELHNTLALGAVSPVNHLGFSAWVEIFMKLDEKKMVTKDCLEIIQQVFAETQDILADRTELDDVLAVEFKFGVTFLEKEHGLNDSTFEEDDSLKNMQENVILDETAPQGFARYVPKVDLDVLRQEVDAKAKDVGKGELMRLTLQNCLRFPIISEMAIEWLGEEFLHGLWRSQNYSTLAPISTRAWALMANLTSEQLVDVTNSANNLTKIVDRMEINFPFGMDLFDKRCRSNTGTTMNIKAHMAYADIERNYSYIHRVWRSFSPYVKCNCNAPCSDTITWLDQALWFTFNHLDRVYPKFTPAGRMGTFLFFVQQNLKKPIMAHLAYLQVQEMMIKMTNKLAANPNCDVKLTFGDTKLVEVCEMMLKNAEFMTGKFKQSKADYAASAQTQMSMGGSDSYQPPRILRNSTGTSTSVQTNEPVIDLTDSIVACTPGEASVSKGNRPIGLFKGSELKQDRLLY